MVNPNSRTCKTYTQQFEAVWNGMSQGYVFWGRDTVDWDARYEQFKPVFEEFDARPSNKPVSEAEYNAAYQGLFEGLLDHHLYGMFTVPRAQYEAIVRPGRNDYEHNINYQKNNNYRQRDYFVIDTDRNRFNKNNYYISKSYDKS